MSVSQGVVVGGQRHRLPGTYSEMNVRRTAQPGTAPNVVAILGTSAGGQGQTPHRFTRLSDAIDTLRSGDLLDAIRFAFDPSPDYRGAAEIVAVRVTAATQASLDLQDADTDNVIALTSVDYGEWTNNLRVKIENGSNLVDNSWSAQVKAATPMLVGADTLEFDTGVGTLPDAGYVKIEDEIIQFTGNTGTATTGTLTGCKRAQFGTTAAEHAAAKAVTFLDKPAVLKVTVENQLVPEEYEIGDNLGEGFWIRYSGAGSSCVVAITVSNGDATTLTTTCAGATSDNLSIDFTKNQFLTLQQVVNYINSQANYAAGLLGDGSAASKTLDAPATENDAKVASPGKVIIQRVMHGVIDWFNDNSDYIDAAVKSTSQNDAPATLAWTPLTSGGDGTENATAWENALNALDSELDVAYLVAATGTSSYQAEALAWIKERLQDGQRIRLFTGCDSGTTAVATVVQQAAAVADARASYYAPGLKYPGLDGTLATYGAWALAAAAAGLTVGLQHQDSLTHKPVRASAAEVRYTKAELETLIVGGVCPLHEVPGRGTRLAIGRTTTLSSTDFYTSQSNMDIADYLVTTLETQLQDQFLGRLMSAALLAGVKEATISLLRQATDDGLLLGTEDNPAYAYGNVVVEVVGTDGVRVEYDARVAGATNYIHQVANFQVGTTG